MISGCARASWATGSSPCRARCAATARGRPGLSARRGARLPAATRRVHDREPLAHPAHALRAAHPPAPGAGACSRSSCASSPARSRRAGSMGWAEAARSIGKDLPRIARERREWAAQRRFGDGRILEGGALPFHPRLLSGPLERCVGAAGLGRHGPELAPRAPPACAMRSRAAAWMKRRVVGIDLALTVAAQLAYKLLGFAIIALLARGLGAGRVRLPDVRAGDVRARGAGHGVRQQRAPDPRGRGGAEPRAATAGRGAGRAADPGHRLSRPDGRRRGRCCRPARALAFLAVAIYAG